VPDRALKAPAAQADVAQCARIQPFELRKVAAQSPLLRDEADQVTQALLE
jgi:hypothetical protein